MRWFVAGLAALILVMALSLVTGINGANIKACRTTGGTPITNFGWVIDCDRSYP